VRALDADAVARGVAGVVLMENAGRGATDAILERFGERLDRVVLLGGPGQNGGDAWVVARHLAVLGYTPRALLLGDEEKVGGDAKPNLDALRSLGVATEVVAPGSLGRLRTLLQDATLLVDGLFGTGLDRPIAGAYAEVVRAMNAHPAATVALDLPSGVDANTGALLGEAVVAALTVTFAAQKRGLWQHPGRRNAGDVVRAHIGVPAPTDSNVNLVHSADVAAAIPARGDAAHKGRAGHVLVVAGSPGTTGAALLSGHGALRGGAGLVTIAARGAAREQLDRRVVEIMTMEARSPEVVVEALFGKQSAVLGPGLGLDEEGRALALHVAANATLPVVLDADALTAIAGGPGIESLKEAAGPRVLTPHPGEAGRLLGMTSQKVQADRYAAATQLAARSGQVVVLKGAGTIVATHHDERTQMHVIGRGTPALAVGGTGDVLAGVVGALLAQGANAFDAAWLGAWLHAVAGEEAAVTDRGLLAREVADAVPRVLSKL